MQFDFGWAMIRNIADWMCIRSGVRFSILFVLVDAILLSLDLQKRTSYKVFDIFAPYIQNLDAILLNLDLQKGRGRSIYWGYGKNNFGGKFKSVPSLKKTICIEWVGLFSTWKLLQKTNFQSKTQFRCLKSMPRFVFHYQVIGKDISITGMEGFFQLLHNWAILKSLILGFYAQDL